MAEREYHRLTRSRRRSSGIAAFNISQFSLWLGPDHLLCIDTNGYTETYKRFYFRDIQAIVTRRTSARMVASIVCSVLAGIFILIGILTNDIAGYITFGVITFVTCLVPLWINLLLGPTCKCQIRTAVQTEDLPITRLRKLRKIRDRLQPLIAEAQGNITSEEVYAKMQVLAGTPMASASTPDSAGRYVIDDPGLPPRILS
jgi:hypothetical protein